MKRLFTLMLVLCAFSFSRAQVEDRFSFLTDAEMTNYAKPLVTALGSAMNTGGFATPSIGTMFGFDFTIKAMMIMIPDDQKTFTPELPAGYQSKPTSTVFGDEGAYYSGPNGYIVYPAGINLSNLPFAFPQLSASFMGAEVMIRMIPSVPVGDEKVNLFGFGLRYDVSNHIPMLPIDVSVGFMYNTFAVTNYVDNKNFALNVIASWSPPATNIVSFYGGLQYENSKMKLTYTYKDPNATIIGQQITKKIDLDITGDNNFRATIGAGLNLGFFGLNIDYNIGALSVLTAGLSFGI